MKDVLSDVLDTVALKGALYFRTHFSAPYAIGVPSYNRAARFHLVVQGHCYVSLPNGQSVLLNRGDLVFVPHGSPHTLADAVERAPAPLEQVLSAAGYSGEGAFVLGAGDPAAATQMVCGHFTFAEGADHPVIQAVPPLLHLTAVDRARLPTVDGILNLIVRRMFEQGPGMAASVSRLSEVLYIEVLRAGMDRAPELNRVLSGVFDPQIGKALSLIHDRIGDDWTVDDLAAAVGMSRSRFAERFRELIGSAPMSYLADWRLQRARALLQDQDLPVKVVANRVGYRSAAAFSRAFSQKFGRPPVRERG